MGSIGGGGGGFGGQATVGCATSKVCIPSCGDEFVPGGADGIALQVCVDGVARCPDNLVDMTTCSLRSCFNAHIKCCDPTTGDVTLAPCQADGNRACPAETPEEPGYTCIPNALAQSGCPISLDHQPCSGPAHSCNVPGSFCVCDNMDGDGGMLWRCSLEIP